ncbi:MAG: hypothetical protein RLN89_12760 [Parvibaculum sp.]
MTITDPLTRETGNAWAHVQTEDATGFLSTRYLLPIPAPDIAKGGIASLLINLSKVGAPTTEATESGSVIHQTYSHGVTHNLHENVFDGMTFTEETLSIEGIDLFQGFLLARAIVASEGPTSYILDVDPIIETAEDGTPFIMDDRDWQIIAIEQSTDKGTAGVYISFTERAD